jgi:hypothetical protein
MFMTIDQFWFRKETGEGFITCIQSAQKIVILPYGEECPVCKSSYNHTNHQIRNRDGKDGYRTLLVSHECGYAIWTKWAGGIPF